MIKLLLAITIIMSGIMLACIILTAGAMFELLAFGKVPR